MQAQREPAVNVPRVLSSFAVDHPKVEVDLRVGTSTSHAEDLRTGRLDLAYVALSRSAADRLELTPLQSTEMQLLVPAAHRLAGRADVELRELAEERFADGPPGWGIRISTDRAFGRADTTRHVAYTVSDVRSLVEFVHYGLAVAIMPPSVVTGADNIRALPIRHHAPFFTTSIARSTERQPGAAAIALLDTARGVAAQQTQGTNASVRRR